MNASLVLLVADATPSIGAALLRTALVLGGLVLLLLVASRGLRRLGGTADGSGPSDLLEVVETRRLDARRAVHLVRVGGQFVLVGVGDGRLTPLSTGELDATEIEACRRAITEQAGAEERRAFLGSGLKGGA